MIILREGNGYFLCLTGLNADQLILKTRDKGVGSELQLLILCGAALKSLTVNFSLVIKGKGIILGSCIITFECDGTAVLLLLLLQSVLNVLVRNGGIRLRNFYALVLSKLDIRLNCYFRRKNKILTFSDLCYLDLRCGDDIQTALLCSVAVRTRKDIIGSILKENSLTVHLLDQISRCFSLAETGQGNIFLLTEVHSLHGLLEILCGNLNG